MSFAVLAATDNLSTFDPTSPAGDSTRSLFILVLAIMGGILLLVEGVLFYSLVRNPRKGGPNDPQPPQVYGSTPIEIAWTAAPLLIVFVLFLLVARVLWEVRPDPSRPPPNAKPLEVTVIGHQWWWEYRYGPPDTGAPTFTTANELRLPVSDAATPRPVYLKLQAADVNHSFWVPRLGGKTDLIPGRTNTMWLQTEQPGLYLGQCAEYCGTAHARMLLRVSVVPHEEFEKWAADEAAPARDDPAARPGRDVFLGLACANCHAVRGTSAKGTYGPDLTHFMSRETLAAGILPNTSQNIREWVRNSQRLKPGCLMPPFDLSDEKLDQVVRYLTSLK